MRITRRLAVVLLAAGAVACGADRSPHSPARPTLAFLGDSITYGIVRGAPAGREAEVDPQGGYPGRLARRLGERARVLNRGIGGATTGFWTAAPESHLGRAMWALVRRAHWFEAGLEPRGESVAVAVLASARPDVVVVLLGVNDIYVRRRDTPGAVEAAVAGLETIVGQVGGVADTVLVATPLPNRRDPPELVAALADAIRTRFLDALPLGERFAERDWQSLFADDVHPNPAGYDRLAGILEELLVARGLVPSATKPGP